MDTMIIGMMMDMTMTSIGTVMTTMMINGRTMDIGQVPIVPTTMPVVPVWRLSYFGDLVPWHYYSLVLLPLLG